MPIATSAKIVNSDDSTTINYSTKHRIVCIGDSMNAGFQPTTSTHIDGWGARVKNFYNFESSSDSYSYGKDGASFNNGEISELIDSNFSKISDPDTITDVIICAGANDFNQNYTPTSVAVNSCVTNVRLKFPNARIVYGNLCFHRDNQTTTQYARQIGAFIESLSCWDAVIPNLYLSCPSRSLFNDSICLHPNSDGLDAIAKNIAQFLYCGCTSTDINISAYFLTKSSAYSPNYTLAIGCGISNGSTILYTQDTPYYLNNFTLTKSDGSEARGAVDVGTIPDTCPIIPAMYNFASLTSAAIFQSGSTFYYGEVGHFIRYDNHLILTCFFTDSTNNFLSNVKIDAIYITRQSATFDAYTGM